MTCTRTPASRGCVPNDPTPRACEANGAHEMSTAEAVDSVGRGSSQCDCTCWCTCAGFVCSLQVGIWHCLIVRDAAIVVAGLEAANTTPHAWVLSYVGVKHWRVLSVSFPVVG
eukprot:1968239-Amphidinium_carterae.1